MRPQIVETPSSSQAGASTGQAMDRKIERSKVRRRPWLIVAGVCAPLLAAGFWWLAPTAGSLAVDRDQVEIATAGQAPFEDYLPVRAEAEPLETVYLALVVNGQVKEVLARDGQNLEKGQPIAVLENAQLQRDVLSREADIAAKLGDVSAQQLALRRAESDRDQEIAQTNYTLLTSKRELEKRQGLAAKGFLVSAGVQPWVDQVEYGRSRLVALRQQQKRELAAAGAQRQELVDLAARLRANLALVHRSLDDLTVRAPVAGQLTNFDLQPGQSLSTGQSIGQVDSENDYKLSADIDEFYLSRVRTGQSATATVDGGTIPLKVSRVFPQVKNGRFHAEFAFSGAPVTSLKRGQSVDVRMTLGETRRVLVLPNRAWLEASGGAYAFVVAAGSRQAERRAIETGRRNPDQVEILSGLKSGDRVIVSSYSQFAKYERIVLR